MCKSPLVRIETKTAYRNATGGISYKAIIKSWKEYEESSQTYKKILEKETRKIDMIPCGKCIECRLNYARDKANQLMMEKATTPKDECWFITLTYDDEHLRTHTVINKDTGEKIEGISLYKKDFQDFIKRLRRNYEYNNISKNIRYFACGEYGSTTNRPHYHAIMYNMPIDITKLKIHTHNELGQPLWNYEPLTKIWGKGYVVIGRVDWEACCYVARYILKKQYGKTTWYYQAQGKEPEFTLSSKKPPLGNKYLLEHKDVIYHTDTIPICNKKTAELVQPPKSFDRYMEKWEPEFMEELKIKRREKAESRERARNNETDLSPWERRIKQAEITESKMKDMRNKI